MAQLLLFTLRRMAAMQAQGCDTRPASPAVVRRFVLMALLALGPAISVIPSRAGDWPQLLGPSRNLVCTETNLAAGWPKEGPPTVWQRSVGPGFSGPVVSGARLILFHRVGDRATVDCLDAKSGKQLWRADYPTDFRDDFERDHGPRATPAISDGRVYTFGAEGNLGCWRLENGEKIWSIDAKEKFGCGGGFFGMACSPLVEGDLVLMNVGGKNGAGIVAFDKVSGAIRWKATDDEASYSSPTAATFEGKRCALILTHDALVAAGPADGKIFFRYPWRPPMHASVSAATPLVIDDLVFISASYGTGASLLRFKPEGPEKVWSGDDILSNHYATSVHYQGRLYGFDGRQEQGCELRCVELKSGKVRWSESGLGAGTVMVINDQLFVLTEKGLLLRAPARPDAFKPVDRAQILPFFVRAYPALADGLFYARSKDKLVCVDLRSRR